MSENVINVMFEKAHEALKKAYAPYSNFQVACCLQTEDGELFTGVNVENSSYGLTTCAETSAICQMVTAGKQQIKHVVILAGNKALCPPCGACRQRIFEFSTAETLVHLCDENNEFKTLNIKDLLPLAFHLNPEHMEPTDV